MRELKEESSIIANSLNRVGFVKFFMANIIMNVNVYTCYDFDGEASESDEMRPIWVSTDSIPYETMWPDDKFWLPTVLRGKKFLARYTFDDDDETIIDGEMNEQ